MPDFRIIETTMSHFPELGAHPGVNVNNLGSALMSDKRVDTQFEGTLPIGISWFAQLLTTALRTKLVATLLFGVRKPTTSCRQKPWCDFWGPQ
jgi:hypothetical protein